ncbi:hypothetical protein PAERUG_E11_London_26_VIM_2_06_13_00566 [Pseudomonas aeruginosa]|nr:hypothetical protein PAERUG_E11_London_26_VIM_2_06_13_00566 [Pseudomonas aeruginosa]
MGLASPTDGGGTARQEQGTIHASKGPEIHLRRRRRETRVRCRRVRTGRSALRAFPPEPEAGQRQERHRFQAGTRPAGHLHPLAGRPSGPLRPWHRQPLHPGQLGFSPDPLRTAAGTAVGAPGAVLQLADLPGEECSGDSPGAAQGAPGARLRTAHLPRAPATRILRAGRRQRSLPARPAGLRGRPGLLLPLRRTPSHPGLQRPALRPGAYRRRPGTVQRPAGGRQPAAGASFFPLQRKCSYGSTDPAGLQLQAPDLRPGASSRWRGARASGLVLRALRLPRSLQAERRRPAFHRKPPQRAPARCAGGIGQRRRPAADPGPRLCLGRSSACRLQRLVAAGAGGPSRHPVCRPGGRVRRRPSGGELRPARRTGTRGRRMASRTAASAAYRWSADRDGSRPGRGRDPLRRVGTGEGPVPLGSRGTSR